MLDSQRTRAYRPGVRTDDLRSYIAGWRRRDAARSARALARAHQARSRLPAAVKLLVEQFGARRVVLFGSLAEGTFTEGSDVDLAVEGMTGDWFRAWDAAERALGPGVRLDLVPIEAARQIVREAVERGEVLHGGH